MGSTCGSCLALMDAGVPIKKPVAGIAMGLIERVKEDGTSEFAILSDIQGMEAVSYTHLDVYKRQVQSSSSSSLPKRLSAEQPG